MSKVTEAIIEHWGKRCPDYHEDCAVCQAWKEHDTLESIKEAVSDYYLPKIKNIFTRLHGGTDAMRDEGHKLWLIYNELRQLTKSELPHE